MNTYLMGQNAVYFDKELLTTELVMKKFTPGSNGSWARDVEIIMKQISPDGSEEEQIPNYQNITEGR